MRLALRFILPLLAILALVAYATIPIFESLHQRWAVRDLDAQSLPIAESLRQPLAEILMQDSTSATQAWVEHTQASLHIRAVAVCDVTGEWMARAGDLPAELDCSGQTDESGRRWHAVGITVPGGQKLFLLYDLGFVKERARETRTYLFYLFAILAIVVPLASVMIAQSSVHRLLYGMRRVLRDGKLRALIQGQVPELAPIARDLRYFLRERETERRTRDETQIAWDPGALKDILKTEMAGDEVITVSNREPYIHSKRDGKIEVQAPASGLVTALEPVMRACSGTWIAHGSGSGDRESVDKHDRVRVPPDQPAYQLRRVWLTEEEERGYYFGFSNEGLWPLCHMAYTRPIFRSSDWEQYVKVNRRFADVVVQEARTDNPVVLVQDYHFALLPRMIRDRLPNATIITFWHIPWPNAEAFGICPWREEIVEGLLGSSIMGFHTRFHCNNFIETVDRLLEARIDRDRRTVSFRGHRTAIKSYPISIAWPEPSSNVKPLWEMRHDMRQRNGLQDDRLIGIGVDRLDYTKGILERFSAVERLLERRPEWIGKFSFIQVAAPSRSSIEQYKNFETEVRALADRINRRFGRENYQPVILKIEHHSSKDVFEYFRASDVCMVTSLHDGMNLVAKEFAAARDDEAGVLILSQFTGAARELEAALIVNPYDIDQCANALHMALAMPLAEQRARMRSMRGLIQEFNVYRWAGRMLIDAARMRHNARLLDRIHDPEPQDA